MVVLIDQDHVEVVRRQRLVPFIARSGKLLDVGDDNMRGIAVINIGACFQFGEIRAVLWDKDASLAVKAIRIADIEFASNVLTDRMEGRQSLHFSRTRLLIFTVN